MGLTNLAGANCDDIQHILAFYNRMFKKKANNNKKIDLHQETEQIRTKAGPNASLTDSANQEKS